MNPCPFCHKSDMPKDQLAKEILRLVGYPAKDYIWCGAFNKAELRAIYDYLKKHERKVSNER